MHILLFILILAVLIFSHELGHFYAAKRAGVRVDEFGFGFPPKLWGKKIGETLYSINLIPFGGFVKIYGEDNESLAKSEDPDRSRSFVGKSKASQAIIVVAGILCNLLLAWVLFSITYIAGFPTSVDDRSSVSNISDIKLRLVAIQPESPAFKAGLMTGDEVVQISLGNEKLTNLTPDILREFVTTHPDSDISILYERNGISGTAIVRPTVGIVNGEEGRPAIGISMDLVGIEKLSIFNAIYKGLIMTAKLTYLTMKGFVGLVVGIFSGSTNLSSVSGPVGIAGLVGDAATLGFTYVLTLAAIISINLAVINLVPFPALDGGRLLFILIEAIKRSPISPRITSAVNLTGFALLMLLMLVITYHDIVKIVGFN